MIDGTQDLTLPILLGPPAPPTHHCGVTTLVVLRIVISLCVFEALRPVEQMMWVHPFLLKLYL